MFSPDLQRRAFRAPNGEFGWTRDDARLAVQVLAQQRQAILGGELWWVPSGATEWTGLIPQRAGPPAVYPWETTRQAQEGWDAFVVRCAQDSRSAIDRWPAVNDLPADLDGRVLYHLTWVSHLSAPNHILRGGVDRDRFEHAFPPGTRVVVQGFRDWDASPRAGARTVTRVVDGWGVTDNYFAAMRFPEPPALCAPRTVQQNP